MKRSYGTCDTIALQMMLLTKRSYGTYNAVVLQPLLTTICSETIELWNKMQIRYFKSVDFLGW